MRFFSVIALGAVLFAAPAFGASQQDREDCNAKDSDRIIAGCTPIIEDKGETAKNRADAYHKRGIALRRKRDYDGAIADQDEAIRLDRKYAIAFYERGIAYERKRDYDRAIKDFSQAIQLDPKFHLAFKERGSAYSKKSEYDRAIQDYNQAVKLNPEYVAALSNRGDAFRAKRDYDRALEDYNEAIRLAPKDVSLYIGRGTVLYSKGDFDRAIEDRSEAIRLWPEDLPISLKADVYQLRGRSWRRKGDFERAIADFSEAIRLDPKDDSYYANRGETYQKKASTTLPLEITARRSVSIQKMPIITGVAAMQTFTRATSPQPLPTFCGRRIWPPIRRTVPRCFGSISHAGTADRTPPPSFRRTRRE